MSELPSSSETSISFSPLPLSSLPSHTKKCNRTPTTHTNERLQHTSFAVALIWHHYSPSPITHAIHQRHSDCCCRHHPHHFHHTHINATKRLPRLLSLLPSLPLPSHTKNATECPPPTRTNNNNTHLFVAAWGNYDKRNHSSTHTN